MKWRERIAWIGFAAFAVIGVVDLLSDGLPIALMVVGACSDESNCVGNRDVYALQQLASSKQQAT